MRYIIEAKTKKADEALGKFMQEMGASNADYIDSYEPKERIQRSVEKVGLALREFKKNGVSSEILHYYLRGKGHSNAEIKAIMGDINDFFKKVGILD